MSRLILDPTKVTVNAAHHSSYHVESRCQHRSILPEPFLSRSLEAPFILDCDAISLSSKPAMASWVLSHVLCHLPSSLPWPRRFFHSWQGHPTSPTYFNTATPPNSATLCEFMGAIFLQTIMGGCRAGQELRGTHAPPVSLCQLNSRGFAMVVATQPAFQCYCYFFVCFYFYPVLR